MLCCVLLVFVFVCCVTGRERGGVGLGRPVEHVVQLRQALRVLAGEGLAHVVGVRADGKVRQLRVGPVGSASD